MNIIYSPAFLTTKTQEALDPGIPIWVVLLGMAGIVLVILLIAILHFKKK